MKKLTAYFTDSEAAGAAAFDLSENFPYCNEILIGSESTEKSHAFDCAVRSAFFGGAIGTTLGFVLTFIPDAGFFSVISPLTGLIIGSVIGAISGCMLDLLGYEEYPRCANITVTVPKGKGGIISRTLRRKGAVSTFLLH